MIENQNITSRKMRTLTSRRMILINKWKIQWEKMYYTIKYAPRSEFV